MSERFQRHVAQATNILERVVMDYGDDVLFAAVDAIKARRAAKRRHARAEAIADIHETAEERKRRGDGQP